MCFVVGLFVYFPSIESQNVKSSCIFQFLLFFPLGNEKSLVLGKRKVSQFEKKNAHCLPPSDSPPRGSQEFLISQSFIGLDSF